MDNLENMPQTIEAEINNSIACADSFVRKNYLLELHNADIAPVSQELANIKTGSNLRLLHVDSIAYENNENVAQKLSNVFSAIAEFNTSAALILDSNGRGVDLYMGTVCNRAGNLSLSFNTFKSSFTGNFPGLKFSLLKTRENEQLLKNIFGEKGIKIAAVSKQAYSKENDGGITQQGIEKLAGGMRGKPFTMVLISKTVPKEQINIMRCGLEALYTKLSPFRKQDYSIGQSESANFSKSFSKSLSESLSYSSSLTKSESFSEGTNESTVNAGKADRDKAASQLLGAGISVMAMLAFGGAGSAAVGQAKNMFNGTGVLQGLFYGSSVSTLIGSAHDLLSNKGETEVSKSEGKHSDHGVSSGETVSTQGTKSVQNTKNIQQGVTTSASKSLQVSRENKSVSSLLDIISKQLDRLNQIEEQGAFDCTAYFITGDNATAVSAANMYRSIISGTESYGQKSAINLWPEQDKTTALCAYLEKMNHPVFRFPDVPGYPEVTAAMLVSANELPFYTAFPVKSLPGLPVSSHADFARDIISLSSDYSSRVRIGQIYHMGKPEITPVELTKADLSGHLFVTGTTGSGKSNFCYGLLNRLMESGLKFLVVEPAKGEYSKVFGGLEGVRVFGTNDDYAPLLAINPFSFPPGIRANEHIDRLVDIFNSCWPMYAAMPAILKEALEECYTNCGFSMKTGKRACPGKFPDFAGLLNALPGVIKKSEFSSEVKGNYIGALVTRVNSLTTGLFGQIFSSSETSSEILFDNNVIIDLSRVGSAETKALIMGVLVMKLQEYRMCSGRMDQELSHVTVLEEAHNLLRSQNSPTAEGVNLRAMSVEMIATAIAEMRTYGEGFIIADQSPKLMDSSVISNTNTKIVFKLPDKTDRLLVGQAIALNDSQIVELATLERGVCAAYQTNWGNAALCKVDYFNPQNYSPLLYKPDATNTILFDSRELISQALSALLKSRLQNPSNSTFDPELCRWLLTKQNENNLYPDIRYAYAFDAIKSFLDNTQLAFGNLCRFVDLLVSSKMLMDYCGDTCSTDINEWAKNSRQYVNDIASLSPAESNELVLLCLNIQSIKSGSIREFYFRYFSYCKQAEKYY